MTEITQELSPQHRAGAVLSVDLGAIVRNWRAIGDSLANGCRAGAVVKADGYGLGAIPAAQALAAAGCRRFFVASFDEGVALRAALPESEILVMNGPLPGHAADFLTPRLVPFLNSLSDVAAWQALARRLNRRLPAALQVDSGLSRLGLSLAEAQDLADHPERFSNISLILLVSHLACADTPAAAMNRAQLQIFQQARRCYPGIAGSLAASSGVFLGPAYHADWVRPGAALYGLRPHRQGPNPMAQVVRLQAKILQLREIDAGQSVGYGATFRATGRVRLATVPLGYADGIFRSLSNRGYGHIGDRRIPMVGRVSMDLTVFDVTGVPDDLVAPGAMIDLIGPFNPPDDLADCAGTLGYEILTSLGPRLQRRYLTGDGA